MRYPATLSMFPHTRSSALPEMPVVQSGRETGYADITAQFQQKTGSILTHLELKELATMMVPCFLL